MNPSLLLRAPRAALESYGATALRLRAEYEVRRRLGLYQRAPRVAHVTDVSRDSSPFDVDLDRVRAALDRDRAIERADRVASGMHQAYRHEWRDRPTTPDAWAMHPLLGSRYPADPWWELRPYLSLDPSLGDVKDAWEPARFTWVFDLALGYAAARDERYADAFWQGVESFVEGNPPFLGIQWSCGQETSIRALSCLWGERVFAGAAATTDARRARIVDLFAWSGERVADAIEYAISQRNNHGISEATGLVALGWRLGGSHPDADRWLRDGARWLERLVLDQFAEDGWYVQHSLNYLRMALEQALVAQRVLVSARGTGLSAAAVARLRAAVALLVELHDAESGQVPNHGANDGSMVLPIATSSYRDFRPAITAAAATFGARVPRSFAASPEALAWLGATNVERCDDPPSTRIVRGSSGWVSARRGAARIFARAGEYASNPSHIDPVHVDVWLEGEPRAVDAGTYRYTASAPWRNGLAAIAVHNTVEIPSLPAAVKGARFLWLERPAAEVTRGVESADATVVELRNRTWESRGVTHRRRCTLSDAAIEIVDEIDTGAEPREVRVHWLVPSEAPIPEISSPAGGELSLISGSEQSVDGWYSPFYASKQPAASVRFVLHVTGRATIFTRFLAANLRCDAKTVLTGEAARG